VQQVVPRRRAGRSRQHPADELTRVNSRSHGQNCTRGGASW
jgi:hypothetical protein